MDSLRGQFSELSDDGDHLSGVLGHDLHDEPATREPPPSVIGQDERRMQVRAYNFWASLLDGRNFPAVEDLDPEELPDFGPHSVLLDFTCGTEDPAVQFLGTRLAEECGTEGTIRTLADVPGRSLLSRITDHYMQIIANQAPIGFEAEFVNHRGATLLYRGILLPFSSDNDTIDFIYGVINWKELADQRTTDELLLEIDQALEARPEIVRNDGPMAEWADGPADAASVPAIAGQEDEAEPLDLTPSHEVAADRQEPASLADCLASARSMAEAAGASEDRTRQSLYQAISRAHDFVLAAEAEPEEFAALLADAGLVRQDRAPFTPHVKLIFGAGYDKTRLAEYAAVLEHARRHDVPRGALAAWLLAAPGGLKGVVKAEREVRREGMPPPAPRLAPRAGLLRKLRKLEHQPIEDVAAEGHEFTLLVARRLPGGEVVLLGEVADDVVLLEKAARKLIG